MSISRLVIGSVFVGAVLGFGSSAAQHWWESKFTAGDTLLDSAQLELASVHGPQPRVVVDEENFDFGAMERDAKMSHNFVFRNEGDAPLHLTKGDTTCKCTLSELAQDEVQPGGSAEVTLQWVAKVSSREFRQTATILTNDPLRKRVQLTVTGNITDAIRIEPSDFVLSNVPVDTAQSAKVRMLDFINDELEVLEHQFTNEETAQYFDLTVSNIAADELAESEAKAGKLLTVTVRPGMPVGGFRQQLEITTDFDDHRTFVIPIHGLVSSDISIIGQGWNNQRGLLSLGMIDSQNGAQAQLYILVHGQHGGTVTMKPEKISPDVIKVEIGEPRSIRDGKVLQYPFLVKVPPGTPQMIHLSAEQGGLGEVILKTNYPRAPQVRLNVSFAVGS